jgi:hypothetical protein
MHENQAAPKAPLPGYALQNAPKWFRLLALFVFSLWVAGVVSAIFLFPRYLPSLGWLRVCEPYATLIGASFALFCTYLAAIGMRHQEQVSGKRRNPVIKAGLLIFGLFLFQFPTSDLIRRGIPATYALVAGDRVEHDFIIKKADGTGSKYCRHEVEVQGMPFLTRLCGISDTIRAQLSPGMPVTFSGKGTWMGLFVEEIRRP